MILDKILKLFVIGGGFDLHTIKKFQFFPHKSLLITLKKKSQSSHTIIHKFWIECEFIYNQLF